MIVDKTKSVIQSPPPSGLIILCSFCALFSWHQTITGAKVPDYIILPDWWILALISTFCIPLVWESIKIDRMGIRVYHLGINTRTISWASISQVVLVPYSGTTPNQKALLFVLENGPLYESSDTAYSFKYKHPSSSYTMILPHSQIKSIIELINILMWEHIKPVVVQEM